MIKIIAFDPGITTGYAIGVIENGCMKLVSGQSKFSHKKLYDLIKKTSPNVILTESFEYRNRARRGLVLFSLEMIGVAALYAEAHDVPLMRQTAMQGKGYYTDAKLKKDKLYKSNKVHANDAARHLLHWFTFGSGFQYNKNGYESGA